MFKQHSAAKFDREQIKITKVSCEKTGTIYYTNGVERYWSKESLLKSYEQDKKDVFQQFNK
jgi:hypothetical protein|tara:strand:+ start:443 stop:625 length:183 start_codon:yes stop_codon:yes gene_type:complete